MLSLIKPVNNDCRYFYRWHYYRLSIRIKVGECAIKSAAAGRGSRRGLRVFARDSANCIRGPLMKPPRPWSEGYRCFRAATRGFSSAGNAEDN